MSSNSKSSARLKSKRRHGDPWVSKNRVLNGGGSTKTKRNCPIYRNPNFDTDETKLLIQLWGDPKVQRELITTHKKHLVISQLAARMEEYGYYRSPEEITTRIKNMKCFYNRLKKEMESCKGMDPSWRHYAEMDAIMTRPIFSVRPNEVPAPSLKYLLEQEKEKRKERKRKAEEEGSIISDSDDDITDILAVPSTTKEVTSKETLDNQTKTETESQAEECKTIATEKNKKSSNQENSQNVSSFTEPNITDAEMSIKMEIESEEYQEYQCNDETTKAKSETNNNSTTEETIKTINILEDEELLVPKMEPIDVDEEYDNKMKQTTTSVLTQNFTQLADILKQPIKTQNIQTAVSSSPAIIQFALSTNTLTTTSSSSITTIPTQSKISVVSPTILMPSQMATKPADLQQRQVRLPGNLHALLAAPGARTTMTNANGMKFLLVNAGDQRGPPITTSNLSTTIPLTGNNRTQGVTNQTNLAIIQNATATQLQQIPQKLHQQQQHQLQQQQFQQQQLKQSQQQQEQDCQQSSSSFKSKETLKRTDVRQDYKEQLKKRDLLGIKTTLLKMLKVQEDANEIQNERLAIERERLQFERTMSEKFFALFEQNQKIQQQLQQQLQYTQQQQQHIQLQQKPPTSSPGTQVFTTTTNQTAVASSGQIMLPPKLLITTMVPTSAASQVASAAAANSKILTTNGFTNLNSTPSNELQLVIPKEEPQY